MDMLYESSSDGSDSTSYFNYSQYVTSSFTGVPNSSVGDYSSGDNDTSSPAAGVHVMQDAERHRIIIIAVIMAFTLLGNLTLIFVLLCKRSRRIKRVNILLVNLAIGDVAVALFVNSTEIFFIAFGDWTLGPLMCKVSVYVQMICLSSTTNLLTSMSIDRYQVIVKPMQSLAKRPRIWLKIAIAWTISLILPIPQLFIFLQYNDGVKYDGTPKRICGSKGYTAQWQRKAYFTFTTVYILVIPIIIMMYCYVKIIRVVWVRAKNESSRRRPSCLIPPRPPATTPTPDAPPKQISESCEKSGVRCGCDGSDLGSVASSPVVSWAKSVKEKKDSNDNASAGVKKKIMDFSDDSHPGSPRMSVRRSLVTASKRRALIMTLSVVISFLVCHLPYFIVNLIRIYSDYKVKLDSLKVFSEFMVMVHSTLNPILYGLFTLRQYHLKYLFSLVTCSHGPAVTATAHGARQRQSSSDERHQLLNTVRSKLTLRSSSEDARVKSLTRSVKKGQKKNFRREQHPNQAASTTAAVMIVSSPSSTLPQPSSSISILNKFRFKQLPVYSKKKRVQFKGKQHNDTLLFANSDAINLKNKRRKKSFGPEHSVMEISASPAARQDFAVGGSLITNTHILKSNGSSPSSSLVGASNVNFRKHGGVSDMTQNSRFTNVDDAEVTRRNKAVPWAPQDDEYIIGGLTRV